MDNQQSETQLLQFIFTQQRVTAALKRIISSTLSQHSEISMAEVGVLLTAIARPGISQKEIATIFRQSHAAISRQMLQLQDKGYLDIGLHPDDKRLTVIHATTLGRSQLQQALAVINDQLSLQLQDADRQLIDQAIQVNTSLVKVLETGHDLDHQPIDSQSIIEIWLAIQQ